MDKQEQLREARRYLEAICGDRDTKDPTVREFLDQTHSGEGLGFSVWAASKALAALPPQGAPASPCPFIVHGKEGTSYCRLAQAPGVTLPQALKIIEAYLDGSDTPNKPYDALRAMERELQEWGGKEMQASAYPALDQAAPHPVPEGAALDREKLFLLWFDIGCRVKARQGQDRNHTCHWPGCTKQVPPAMWGCKDHWFKLPYRLREEIWASYRPGQEKDMNPSAAYMEAANKVQEWIRRAAGPAQEENNARI